MALKKGKLVFRYENHILVNAAQVQTALVGTNGALVKREANKK
jgi:hypothetical protein